jgi:hypothetical protein
VQETSVGGIVLPHLGGVVVERIESSAEATWMYARVRAESAACPGCATMSRSVRSHYERRLSDTPIGGRPVWLVLRVRRFTCPADGCPVRTFVEQVPGLTVRRRRRSQPLKELLHGVGATLAGRAGVRLATKLTMRVSRSTLLRLLRAGPEPVLTCRRGCSGWMISRCGGDRSAPRSCSTWKPTGRSTYCPTGRPTPWPRAARPPWR